MRVLGKDQSVHITKPLRKSAIKEKNYPNDLYKNRIREIKRNQKNTVPSMIQKRLPKNRNRAGNLKNHSNDPYEFIFEGENEQSFNCIQLAIAELTEPDFMDFVN